MSWDIPVGSVWRSNRYGTRHTVLRTRLDRAYYEPIVTIRADDAPGKCANKVHPDYLIRHYTQEDAS